MDRDLSTVIKAAGTQTADDPFEFVMSTNSVDRMGDTIDQKGWQLGEFRKNPIALFGHDHKSPIGTWANVRVEGGKLMGKLKMAAQGTSQLVDEVRSLLEQRVLRAVSVGFTPIEYEFKSGDEYAIDFKKQALHECSVVSVPANQDAVLAMAKNYSPEVRRELMRSVSGAKTPSRGSDFDDLIGDPSEVVRARRNLQRRGLI